MLETHTVQQTHCQRERERERESLQSYKMLISMTN